MRDVTALPVSHAAAEFAPDSLAELSDQEVKDELTTWAGRVAAGEARLLAYVGELDERRAWAEEGIISCAAWLSWRLGMGLTAASEKVRVARSLRRLPLTFTSFLAGRLSFTKVRALTRMQIEGDEEAYLSIAEHASGAQLERLAGGMRRARKYAEKDRKREDGEPVPRTSPRASVRYDADGDMLVTLRLSAADGQVLVAALDAARTDLDAESAGKSSAEDFTPRAGQGDGFLRLAQGYLRHRAKVHPARARRDRARLICQVDPLSGWVRLPDGEILPPAVAAAERLSLPGGMALRRLRAADLRRFDLGRSRREPDQDLRDLLGVIDGERCRFPGCRHTRRLHAHHLRYWGAGGRTDLGNLVLLCERHHVVVHAERFRLTLDPRTRVLTVATRRGAPVPHLPGPPSGSADDLDAGRAVGPETVRPHLDGSLDLHYAVNVLLYRSELLAAAA